MPRRDSSLRKYDVCLSFAGEDRRYVKRVASALASRGIRVFFDEHEAVQLWGKDLFAHLEYVYRDAAKYCVLFISRHYAAKLWTNHERKSAQARAFRQNREYILPARFDSTEIPGLLHTVGYVDLRRTSPTKLARMVTEKLGPRQRQSFMPPIPDRLFKAVNARTSRQREEAGAQADAFFRQWERMSKAERNLVAGIFLSGCPAHLPQEIHINLDLLKRETGFSIVRIKKLLGNIRSLGFYTKIKNEKEDGYLGKGQQAFLEYRELSTNPLLANLDGTETGFVNEIVEITSKDLCQVCAAKALGRADFGQLSSMTAEHEKHRKRKPAVSHR